jgi:LuxR family maltose regulon positive regulatory protein
MSQRRFEGASVSAEPGGAPTQMLSSGPILSGERRGLIPRERLTSRLLAAKDASIALVVAPAGYGKTTVLSEWDAADERPFVWVTLNDRDNDPARLLGSIAREVGKLGPIDQGIFDALSAPLPSISNVVVPRLLAALDEHEGPFVLVLDDVQVVDEPVSLSALSALAEQLPPSTQLAIAARSEPPIGVGRLRAHRRLVELHPHDLVMTRSEAAQLLRAAGLEFGPGTVKRLFERTEGWPAALYLATLTLEGESDPMSAIERFAGDDRIVADYLRDEFLARQSSDDLDFLTATSLLDRMSGSLCDAMLWREGSAETLRRLSRSNLLLVPLDRKDEQYRYHALMREMLQSELHRLGERAESELHARASRWYAEHGDLDHAIPHAISAGNLAEAGRLIWARLPYYESHGREATMRRWLDRFTEEEVAASPYLCVAKAANHATRGEGARCERWTFAAMEVIANAREDERGFLEAAAAVVRGAGAARDGVAQMGMDASRGYEVVPNDSPWRALCRYLEGTAHHLAGDRERARPELEEASRRGAAALPNVRTLALSQLALLARDEGDGATAAALALHATTEADRFGLNDYPTSALLFAVSALVRARRGRVEDATRDAKRSARLLALLTDFSPWYEAETRIVLARGLLLLDDVPAARGHLADAVRYLRQAPDAVVLEEWLEAASWEAQSVARIGGEWPLTKAELRLLHFLPTHLSFREIAEQLFVSTNTVKSQAQAIYRKLGVASRAEAVACGQAAGLIHSGEAAAGEGAR